MAVYLLMQSFFTVSWDVNDVMLIKIYYLFLFTYKIYGKYFINEYLVFLCMYFLLQTLTE